MKQFVGSTCRLSWGALLAIILMFAASRRFRNRSSRAAVIARWNSIRGPQRFRAKKSCPEPTGLCSHSESPLNNIKALYRIAGATSAFGRRTEQGSYGRFSDPFAGHRIVIEGAQRISAKKLRKAIDLKINAPVSEDELQKGREKIIENYQKKGFTDVDVKFRIDTDEARGTSRVVYTITEGTKGAIHAIQFEGNTKFKDGILRKQMKTKGKTLYSIFDKSGARRNATRTGHQRRPRMVSGPWLHRCRGEGGPPGAP